MSFRDLEEFLDPTLKLPIRGKTYVVQSPDARTGLWLQGIMTAAVKADAGDTEGLDGLVLDDDEERDALARVLGDTYQQLLDDDVPWHYVKHAGQTVMLWVVHGKEIAEVFWNGPAGTPKGRKRRKGGAKKARPVSAGSSTHPAPTEAPRSGGATSSPTGD